MNNYIDKSKKLKDVQSTGYTFTFVGLLGIILVILLDLDKLPFKIVSSQKILFTIVMSIVFIIFIIIGILSFLSLTKLKKEANRQEKEAETIVSSFINNHAKSLNEISSDDENDLFFARNSKIESILTKEYESLSESELEHYAEEIYDKLFTE